MLDDNAQSQSSLTDEDLENESALGSAVQTATPAQVPQSALESTNPAPTAINPLNPKIRKFLEVYHDFRKESFTESNFSLDDLIRKVESVPIERQVQGLQTLATILHKGKFPAASLSYFMEKSGIAEFVALNTKAPEPEKEEMGVFENLGRGMAEMGVDIGSGFIRSVAIALDSVGNNDLSQDMRSFANEWDDKDFGSNQMTTYEDVKNAPWENTIKFALEGFIKSLPFMAVAMIPVVGMPLAYIGLAGMLARERAKNDERKTATGVDLLAVAPAALLSVILERFQGKMIFGKTALSALKNRSAKEILKATGKTGLTEGIVDALQEGVLEYSATTLFTKKGFDVNESIESAIQGALIGGIGAGGLRGITASAQAVTGNTEEGKTKTAAEIKDRLSALGIDEEIRAKVVAGETNLTKNEDGSITLEDKEGNITEISAQEIQANFFNQSSNTEKATALEQTEVPKEHIEAVRDGLLTAEINNEGKIHLTPTKKGSTKAGADVIKATMMSGYNVDETLAQYVHDSLINGQENDTPVFMFDNGVNLIITDPEGKKHEFTPVIHKPQEQPQAEETQAVPTPKTPANRTEGINFNPGESQTIDSLQLAKESESQSHERRLFNNPESVEHGDRYWIDFGSGKMVGIAFKDADGVTVFRDENNNNQVIYNMPFGDAKTSDPRVYNYISSGVLEEDIKTPEDSAREENEKDLEIYRNRLAERIKNYQAGINPNTQFAKIKQLANKDDLFDQLSGDEKAVVEDILENHLAKPQDETKAETKQKPEQEQAQEQEADKKPKQDQDVKEKVEGEEPKPETKALTPMQQGKLDKLLDAKWAFNDGKAKTYRERIVDGVYSSAEAIQVPSVAYKTSVQFANLNDDEKQAYLKAYEKETKTEYWLNREGGGKDQKVGKMIYDYFIQREFDSKSVKSSEGKESKTKDSLEVIEVLGGKFQIRNKTKNKVWSQGSNDFVVLTTTIGGTGVSRYETREEAELVLESLPRLKREALSKLKIVKPRPLAKSAKKWLSLALSSKKDPRKYFHYSYVHDGWVYATNGHISFRIKNNQNLPDGFQAKDGNSVDEEASLAGYPIEALAGFFSVFDNVQIEDRNISQFKTFTIKITEGKLNNVFLIDNLYFNSAYIYEAANSRDQIKYKVTDGRLIGRNQHGEYIVMAVNPSAEHFVEIESPSTKNQTSGDNIDTPSQIELDSTIKDNEAHYNVRENEDKQAGIALARKGLGDVDRAAERAVSAKGIDPSETGTTGDDTASRPPRDVHTKQNIQPRQGTKESNDTDNGKSFSGIKTLGIGITADFIQRKWIDYRGTEIKSIADIARVAAIYRNPQFETLRIYLTKGDKIVSHWGISSRLPGMVRFGGGVQATTDIIRRMRRTGADGFYLSHNHPTGNPTPSDADFNFTKMLSIRVPGFRGHIVTNGDTYASFGFGDTAPRQIKWNDNIERGLLRESARSTNKVGDKVYAGPSGNKLFKIIKIGSNDTAILESIDGNTTTAPMWMLSSVKGMGAEETQKSWRIKDFSEADKSTKHLESSIDHALIGQVHISAENVRAIARQIHQSDDMVTLLFFNGGTGKLSAIQEIPKSLFENKNEIDGYIANRQTEFGATDVIPVSTGEAENRHGFDIAVDLMRKGLIIDYIANDVSMTSVGTPPDNLKKMAGSWMVKEGSDTPQYSRPDISRRDFLAGLVALALSPMAKKAMAVEVNHSIVHIIQEGGKLKKVLGALAQTVTDPNAKQLVTFLAEHISDNWDVELYSNLTPAKNRAWVEKMVGEGRLPQHRIAYDVQRVEDSAGFIQSLRVKNPTVFLLEAGLKEKTILHEAIHAYIDERYMSLRAAFPKNYRLLKIPKPKALPELVKIRRMKNSVKRFVRSEGIEKNLSPSIRAAINDPDEFIAYALADSKFQAFLKTLDYNERTGETTIADRPDGQNILEKIFTWIVEAVGWTNAFDYFMDVSNEMFRKSIHDPNNFEFTKAWLEDDKKIAEEKNETQYAIPAPASAIVNGKYDPNKDPRLKRTKVVDVIGKPKVTYHGTHAVLSEGEFSQKLLGKNTGAMSAKEGFFFSDKDLGYGARAEPNKKDVDAYRIQYQKYLMAQKKSDIALAVEAEYGRRAPSNRTMTEMLRLTKIRNKRHDDLMEAYAETSRLREEITRLKADQKYIVKAYLSINNPFVFDYKGRTRGGNTYFKLIKKAKEKGHDGAIFLNTFDGVGMDNAKTLATVYVVFSPHQIIKADSGSTMAQDAVPDKGTHEWGDNIQSDYIKNKIERIANEIVPKSVKVKIADTLSDPKGNPVAGKYHENVISVSMAYDPIHAIHHETIHALKGLNLFSDKEWKALKVKAVKDDWIGKHKIRQRYPEYFIETGSPKSKAIEEAIADEFAQWAINKNKGRKTALNELFERIRQFFIEVAKMLHLNGFTPPSSFSVFSDIHSGKVARRDVQGVKRPVMPMSEVGEALLSKSDIVHLTNLVKATIKPLKSMNTAQSMSQKSVRQDVVNKINNVIIESKKANRSVRTQEMQKLVVEKALSTLPSKFSGADLLSAVEAELIIYTSVRKESAEFEGNSVFKGETETEDYVYGVTDDDNEGKLQGTSGHHDGDPYVRIEAHDTVDNAVVTANMQAGQGINLEIYSLYTGQIPARRSEPVHLLGGAISIWIEEHVLHIEWNRADRSYVKIVLDADYKIRSRQPNPRYWTGNATESDIKLAEQGLNSKELKQYIAKEQTRVELKKKTDVFNDNLYTSLIQRVAIDLAAEGQQWFGIAKGWVVAKAQWKGGDGASFFEEHPDLDWAQAEEEQIGAIFGIDDRPGLGGDTDAVVVVDIKRSSENGEIIEISYVPKKYGEESLGQLEPDEYDSFIDTGSGIPDWAYNKEDVVIGDPRPILRQAERYDDNAEQNIFSFGGFLKEYIPDRLEDYRKAVKENDQETIDEIKALNQARVFILYEDKMPRFAHEAGKRMGAGKKFINKAGENGAPNDDRFIWLNVGLIDTSKPIVMYSLADIEKLPDTAENRPAKALARILNTLADPNGHPYIHGKTKTRSDIEKAAQKYFGNFDPKQEVVNATDKGVKKYLDSLISGAEDIALAPENTLELLEVYKDGNKTAVINQQVQQINELRLSSLERLKVYLENVGGMTPTDKAIILKIANSFTVTKTPSGSLKVIKITADNTHDIADVVGGIAPVIAKFVKEGKTPKQALMLAYEEVLKKAQEKSKDLNRQGWVKFDKTDNFGKAQELNLACLGGGNKGNQWCTSTGGAGTAQSHLSKGDFLIYYDNNEPEIAIRMEGNKVKEIAGRHGGSAQEIREDKYYDIAKQRIEEGGYDGKGFTDDIKYRQSIRDFLDDKISREEFLKTAYVDYQNRGKPFSDNGIYLAKRYKEQIGHAGSKIPLNTYKSILEKVGDIRHLDYRDFKIIRMLSVHNVTYTGVAADEVIASGTAKIKIDGNVDGKVSATGTSEITIGGNAGNVYGRHDAQITVGKNVGGMVEGFASAKIKIEGDAGDVVEGWNDAQITIKGNVKEWIFGYDKSKVTVGGDVTGRVQGKDKSKVTVGGDAGSVQGKDKSKVTVGGDVKFVILADDYSRVTVVGNNTDFIEASGNGKIKIGGDVGNFVRGRDKSQITVGGNLGRSVNGVKNSIIKIGGNAGGAVRGRDKSQITVGGNVGEEVHGGGNSIIKVGGNVGFASFAGGNSKITVGGNVGRSVHGDVTILNNEEPMYSRPAPAEAMVDGKYDPAKDPRLVGAEANLDTAVTVQGKRGGVARKFYRGMTQPPEDGNMRPSSYFSASKRYATGYSDLDVFGVNIGKEKNSSVATVYLSLSNVLDTRKPQHKKIWDEFYAWLENTNINKNNIDGIFWNSWDYGSMYFTSNSKSRKLSLKGLPKAEIMEWKGAGTGLGIMHEHQNFNVRAWDFFLNKKGYKFDGILIDEGVSEVSYESSNAPLDVDISIVVRNPNSVINAETGDTMAVGEDGDDTMYSRPINEGHLPPEVQKRWDAATPARPRKTILEKTKDGAKAFFTDFARLYPNLKEKGEKGNETYYAEILEKLLQLRVSGQTERDRVENFIKTMTQDMTEEETKLIQLFLSLKDQIWTYDQRSQELKFGFKSIDELIKAKESAFAEIEKSPKLKEKIEFHEREGEFIRQALISSGVLTEEDAANPNYMANQVIFYDRIIGAGSSEKVSTANVKRRKGTARDTHQNYVGVTSEWMYKARTDIKIAEFLTWLSSSKYNKMPEFKKMALQSNDERLTQALQTSIKKDIPKTTFANKEKSEKAITELMTAKTKQEFSTAYRKNRDALSALNAPESLLEEFMGYKKQTAINIQRLLSFYDVIKDTDSDMLKEMPPHVIKALENSRKKLPSLLEEEKTNIWQAIYWLANHQSMGVLQQKSLMLLSTKTKRVAFEKRLVADNYVDPNSSKQLINAYSVNKTLGTSTDAQNKRLTAWQADAIRAGVRAIHMYSSKTLPEHLLQGVIDGLKSSDVEANKRIVEAFEKLNSSLVLGAPKQEMILEFGISSSLDNFRDKNMEKHIYAGIIPLTRAWKQYALFNPKRLMKYILNNRMSDLDFIIASGHFLGIRKHIVPAFTEIKDYMLHGKTSEILEKAITVGAVMGGQTHYEIESNSMSKITDEGDLEVYIGNKKSFAYRWGSKYFTTARDFAMWSENAVRYAAYKFYHQEIVVKGKTPAEIGYGASRRFIVDGLTDPEMQVAVMARSTMGDYANVGNKGRKLRRASYPFFSWTETNTVRYLRLFENAYITGTQDFGKGAGQAGAALVGLSLAAVGKSLSLATWMATRAFIFWGAVASWNFMFGEDEDELLRKIPQTNLYVILDKDDDGNVYTMNFYGSLMTDFAEWIGMEKASVLIGEMAAGRANITDILQAMGEGGVNHFIQGMSPFYKMVPELLLGGNTYYPDVFRPRKIESYADYFAKMFDLLDELNFLSKLVNQPGATPAGKEYLLNVAGIKKKNMFQMQQQIVTNAGYRFDDKNPVAKEIKKWKRSRKQAIRLGDKEAQALAEKRLGDLNAMSSVISSERKSNKHPVLKKQVRDRQDFAKFMEGNKPSQNLLLFDTSESREYMINRSIPLSDPGTRY